MDETRKIISQIAETVNDIGQAVIALLSRIGRMQAKQSHVEEQLDEIKQLLGGKVKTSKTTKILNGNLNIPQWAVKYIFGGFALLVLVILVILGVDFKDIVGAVK